MRPGQAAEFNPLQHVGKLCEVISLDETHRDPVWPTAAQTIRKVLAILGQPAHCTEWDRKINREDWSALDTKKNYILAV